MSSLLAMPVGGLHSKYTMQLLSLLLLLSVACCCCYCLLLLLRLLSDD